MVFGDPCVEQLERFPSLQPQVRVALCYSDPVLFCRWYLGHLFSKPMPWAHRALLAILLRRTDFLYRYGEVDKIIENFVDEQGRPIFIEIPRAEGPALALRLGVHTLIMMPRGFSKTTIAGQAVPLYNIVYQELPFLFYLSETATHARMQATNVRRELDDNPRLKADFGVLKPKMSDEQKWAEHFFETTTGFAVGTQGRGGQVRGMNHRGQRPRSIILDDVEDPDSVTEAEQRSKTRRWFYADVMPALPPLDKTASLVVLGTILHKDALLAHLEKDRDFTVVRLGAMDKHGEPLWPAYMSKEEYQKKRLQFQERGLLHLFHMEYDNRIVETDASPFQERFFQYGEAPPLEKLRVSVYCDPAISPKRTADEAVIAVAGIEEGTGRIWKLDEWAKIGATPRDIIDTFFTLRRRWGFPRHNGVESNAYQAALVHLLREEMFRKRDYFEVVAVNNQTKKELRIQGVLQPRYSAGYVWHVRRFPEYETQLLDWPNPQRFDRADAMAGAIALLDPHAAEAAGEDLGRDQYGSLDDELPDWRVA